MESISVLPYLVLLQVGFAKLSQSLGILVSSYLTISPLPFDKLRAVSFLWHFPYPEHIGTVVISDHPALWSPDFPPVPDFGTSDHLACLSNE